MSCVVVVRMETEFANANESIQLVVHDATGVHSFNPMYTHMCFGDDERLRGWKKKELEIDVHVNIKALCTCVATCTQRQSEQDETGRKVEKLETQGGRKEDALALLAPMFESEEDKNFKLVTRTMHEDDSEFKAENLLCVRGMTKLNERPLADGYEVLSVQLGENCDESVRKLHMRLQSLAPFFIDGASVIEPDDPRWRLLLVVKLRRDRTKEYAVIESLAGFATVYAFFSYPSSTRLRLGQCLVLPPFTKKGHGTALVRGVYELAYTMDNVIDVTVEDPTDAMQLIQVKLDFARIYHDKYMPMYADGCIESAVVSNDWTHLMPPADTAEHVRQYKVNPRQFRRCWECFLVERISNPAYLCGPDAPPEDLIKEKEKREKVIEMLRCLIRDRVYNEFFAKLKEKKNVEKKVCFTKCVREREREREREMHVQRNSMNCLLTCCDGGGDAS